MLKRNEAPLPLYLLKLKELYVVRRRNKEAAIWFCEYKKTPEEEYKNSLKAFKKKNKNEFSKIQANFDIKESCFHFKYFQIKY